MKGLITMLFSIISAALNNLFFFALHVENYSVFPKPLSRKEEAECFESMAKGEKDARCKLIEHNLRLVAHIIKKYYSSIKSRMNLYLLVRLD